MIDIIVMPSIATKKLERERNEFQRKFDKAIEETRMAKAEAQKEREEAKHVRRRLTSYLQNKEDGACKQPSRDGYKPLSIDELMKKDFSCP